MAQAAALQNDPNTVVYFADAPSPIGPMASVLAFKNYDFLGGPQGMTWKTVQAAQIFLLDNISSAGHKDVLIVGVVQPPVAPAKPAPGQPATPPPAAPPAVTPSVPARAPATVPPKPRAVQRKVPVPATPAPSSDDSTAAPTPAAPIVQATAPTLTYYAFTGEGRFDDGKFSAILTNDVQDRILTLRSDDVYKGRLAGTIQIKVYLTSANGTEAYLGKFSYLTGFAH